MCQSSGDCDDVVAVMRKNPLSLKLQTLSHTQRQEHPSSGTFPFKTYCVHVCIQCEWVEKQQKSQTEVNKKISRATMLVMQGLEK